MTEWAKHAELAHERDVHAHVLILPRRSVRNSGCAGEKIAVSGRVFPGLQLARTESSGRKEEAIAVARTADLTRLLLAIADLDHNAAAVLLSETPSLATARVARREEFFLAERLVQVYEGDTALHAAGFSYDCEMARGLITRGVDIRARNRRGAEPLHAAVIGVPGSASWNPTRQRDVILYLIEAGADPNAVAAGGVTPLHRAVRNRCSAAVGALLRAGADPRLRNDRGSTASELAYWTTGRGGTGSPAARAEQRIITELLAISTA